ncbi:MAG TPA: universal stress protein [Acidimicrobiales bacterium]
MPDTIVLCSDGSDLAHRALAAGLAVVRPGGRLVVATVIDPVDTALVTGTGMAGGVMTPEAFDRLGETQRAEGQQTADATVAALGLEGAETRVLRGSPGPALCDLAAELGAAAMVIGSRGRGGLARALLGSVSDHVVRHAPCPVVITTPEEG